jgi:hypothetical protein
MDILGTLPVWAQLLIAVLVAGVLIVMNVGWLIQARGWLERQQQQRRAGGAPSTGTTPTGTTSTSTGSTARPERDRA